MAAVLKQFIEQQDVQSNPPVVVIGTGPVGIKFVEELLKKAPDTPVVIYGNEPWEPYNRVRLSNLLTGEIDFESIQNPLKTKADSNISQYHNCEITLIDPENRTVTDETGRVQFYSKLVIATGSTPHIPSIPGIEKSGIYTFRNLDDAQNLIARRTRSRHAVILGGGLLGIEAAHGLKKHNTSVTIIDHSSHLMFQQLDEDAGELLHEHLIRSGLRVILKDSVKRVIGDNDIKFLELRSGRKIACDTLVISAGIKPNIDLALNAGIYVGRGIRVNDLMQTNSEDIYAIGECAEHRGKVYGLVAPGFEQAAIAAHSISGGQSSYTGSQVSTRLKVIGVNVFSVGDISEGDITQKLKILTWKSSDNTCYRKIIMRRNKLIGAIAYGQWSESNRVQESVLHTRHVWPWQIKRFYKTGNLWPDADISSVVDWPASAIVCQCTNTNRGTLSEAISAGSCSVQQLCEKTGASSVCGSCKPLLTEMLGAKTIEPEPGKRSLVVSGAISLIVALLLFFAPAIPYPDTVQLTVKWDQLWRSELIKQISGYTLLGFSVLLAIISLRKRIKPVTLGKFTSWRVIHVVMGLLAIATLIAHTGLRLGDNLNLYLMLSFTGLILAGAVASGSIGLQHLLPRVLAQRTRALSIWSHIILLWPLPALLGFHILKGYWY